jgi:sugar/nucleoside kinase (ribokinase family)
VPAADDDLCFGMRARLCNCIHLTAERGLVDHCAHEVREVGDLRADELDATWFDCDVLHVSGYSLLSEPAAGAAAAAVVAARERSARVSVDLSTWSRADAAFAARVRALEPDIVFATERERDAVGDVHATWVVKRGAAGIIVDGTPYPAIPVEVVDTTGAGDALAAGFLVDGPELGLAAAARCCARIGAMP